MRAVLSALVRIVAPSPGVAGLPTCKFHPSCSEYASLAVRRYGLARGAALALWRILRCHPFSRGGVDFPGGVRA